MLPDELKNVRGGMFAAMRPARLRSDVFMVPLMKDGHAGDEYSISLYEGEWNSFGGPSAIPGGSAREIEDATAKLKETLGSATDVRVAVFLPSGWVFAVGNNDGQEAAVYLNWWTGDGVTGVVGRTLYPYDGQLFTPEQLYEYLTPGAAAAR